jgi:hypothetical protein
VKHSDVETAAKISSATVSVSRAVLAQDDSFHKSIKLHAVLDLDHALTCHRSN